jgi:glycosyltransferase involved in cell wall biosynthesis
MRVLLSALSFEPNFGGPARSVPQLAEALAGLGMDVGLWAPDGSAKTSPLLAIKHGLQFLDGTAEDAWKKFGKVDILHDNGIWRPHHLSLMKLAEDHGAVRVVSARGMLTPWALNHKPLRKRLAWWTYQRRSLTRASALHATAESERKDLTQLGLRPMIGVIPNGVHVPTWKQVKSVRKVEGEAHTCLFMSRLNPKKGIPMLLDAWARLRPEGWELHIAGPDEDGYQLELEKQIAHFELGRSVRFIGAIEGKEKLAALCRADLFVLPTHSENFGIVVAEALAHGCPVITTHGAPWQMLETERCGWWVSISVNAIASALKEAMDLGVKDRQRMGERGREYVERHFSWEDIARRSIEFYEEAARS